MVLTRDVDNDDVSDDGGDDDNCFDGFMTDVDYHNDANDYRCSRML